MSGLLPELMEGMKALQTRSDSNIPFRNQQKPSRNSQETLKGLLLNIKSQLPSNNHPLSAAAIHHFAEHELNRSSTIYDKFVTIKFVAKLKIALRKYPAEKGR